jgi:hypothetical protein
MNCGERERNAAMRININAKLLLNHQNYILKAMCKRIKTVNIYEIKENVRPKM